MNQIGKGSFGTVFKVMKKTEQKIMACKELNYSVMKDREK